MPSQESTPQPPTTVMPARGRLLIGILAISAMLAVVNLQALNAFLPFVADDVGTSVPILGQIATIVSLLSAAGGIVVGPLADRYGQRRFQIGGAILIVVSSVGTAAAVGFGTLLAARLVSAFSGAMLIGVTFATTATLFDGEARRKAVSLVIAGQAIAPIIGVPLLTFTASIWNWRASFIVMAIGAAIVAILQWALLPAGQSDGTTTPFQFGSLLTAYAPLIRNRAMRALYGSHFMRTTVFIGTLTYFGAYLQKIHHFNERQIGWAFMIAGIGYFAGSLLVGGRLGRMPLRPLTAISTLLIGLTLTAAFTLPLGVVGPIGFVTIAAFAYAIAFVSHTTLLATESPAGRATTMSFNGTVFGLGGAGGGAIGGLLIAVSGYATLAIGLAGYAVVSAMLVWKPRRQEELEPSIGSAN